MPAAKKSPSEKRIKQSEKRHDKNVAAKSKVKTAFKKTEAAIAQGKNEEAKVLAREAVVTIDKAASKRIVHKNKAARKKSRLVKKLNTSAKP
ncbi:MAG: 30S ribosomal protein S20 [Candidatus Eremiobacteraeota bacterium]|nr:30S ribosomal protein S20 [Candidatus Eremiobacteraeota bacterium]